MEDTFDLIIIGAGTAGCLAAYTAAKEGLNKIALIDRKEKKNIGKKICGDGIGTKHLEFLQEMGFPIKENDIITNTIKKAYIVSPENKKEDVFPVEGQLAIINRHKFGQALLNHTLNEKITLFDKTYFKNLDRKDGKVKAQLEGANGQSFTITAPLIIDGSGINSKIRERLDIFDKYAVVRDDEQYFCYREIAEIKNPPEKYIDSTIFEFSFEKTRGGYIWFFSRGNGQWNLGNGIPKSWIDEIQPRDIFNQYMKNRFDDYTTIDAGGGFVPTRHPIPSHVKDNIILIGDAGAIVNPLHGGGLSPSLASGHIAGKIAAKLIPNEMTKEEHLWVFNQKIMERYGLRYSILDLYRILLQNIPDNELLHAMENDYLPVGKIFYAREYEQLMMLARKLSEIWKEIPNRRFNLLPNYLEEINNLTMNYPKTPVEISLWAERYNSVYDNYLRDISITKEFL
ncbi:MAG: geranylgeranyl reductase family protein [Asgard group archaeon]|nr:geranylgeranyl reductase family protein [Asgard group archaeon]